MVLFSCSSHRGYCPLFKRSHFTNQKKSQKQITDQQPLLQIVSCPVLTTTPSHWCLAVVVAGVRLMPVSLKCPRLAGCAGEGTSAASGWQAAPLCPVPQVQVFKVEGSEFLDLHICEDC